MLVLPEAVWLEIVAHIYAGLPNESCGLLAGRAAAEGADLHIERFYPCRNDSESALRVHAQPARPPQGRPRRRGPGAEILGVVHSHTHTDAYPSPTDVREAPDPAWHYPIVSLRDLEPVLRSYRIVGETITEESVDLVESESERLES